MTADTTTLAAPEARDSLQPATRASVVKALITWLGKGDEADRCHAARALGQLRARHGIPALVQHLKDEDVDVCVEAAMALATIGPDRVSPEAMNTDQVGPGEVGNTHVLAALQHTVREDPDPEVKTAAFAALSQLAEKPQVPFLIEIARAAPENIETDATLEWDPWWDMQLSAVRALGRLNATEAAAVLDELVDDEDGQDIEAELLMALAKIENEGERRVEARLGASTARQRRRCVSALALSKSASSLKALGRTLLDQDPDVRVAALEAIARRKASQYLSVTLKLFRDGEATVRDAAVQASEQLITGSRDNSPALDNLFKQAHDPDPQVRKTVLRALAAATNGPRVDAEIERLICDPDPQVQEAACDLAAHCSIADIDSRLLAMVDNDHTAVAARRAALHAIGTRGHWNEQVARVFAAVIDTPNTELRLAALKGLVQLQSSTGATATGDLSTQPLMLVLAALRGEILTVTEATTSPQNPPQTTLEIPVELTAEHTEPTVFVEILEDVEAGNLRPATSSLQAIGIDNAEVALALAEHEGSDQDDVEIDEETAQYVALTEQNEATARWLFAKAGLERDLDVRALAARTLKSCPHEAAAAALIAVLDEDDAKLQAEAMSALAEIASAPGIELPVQAAKDRISQLTANDDRNLRLMALRVLSRSGVGHAEVFLKAINDQEPMVRIEALHALTACGSTNLAQTARDDPYTAFNAAIGSLCDPVPSVRLAAVRAAIQLANESEPPLVEATRLANTVMDAVFTGSGDQPRAFARILRDWNAGVAAAACLAKLEVLENSTAKRYAIEFLEELYLDAGNA